MVCGAVYLLCRFYRVGALLPIVAVAFLMVQLGPVQASQVPVLSQMKDAKDGLRAWSDEQQYKAREAAAQMRQNQAALDAAEGP